jgi:hypothetical protein
MKITLVMTTSVLVMLTGCDQIKQKASCDDYFEPNNVSAYQVLDGGMALHVNSDIVWYRCPAGQYFGDNICQGEPLILNWTEANLFAAEFSENSNYQWRLPTNDEFQSITTRECINPAVNTNVFPQLPIENYWTLDSATTASSRKCLAYTYQGSIACRESASAAHRFMLVAKP